MGKLVYIFTDGSVYPNPGKGGAAYVIYKSDGLGLKKICSGSKSFRRTTNNRMELMAVILALQRCKRDEQAIVYTDSQYISENYMSLIARLKQGLKVSNPDLWLRLGRVIRRRPFVIIKWVRGHYENKQNEEAHNLAYKAMLSPRPSVDKEFEKKEKDANRKYR